MNLGADIKYVVFPERVVAAPIAEYFAGLGDTAWEEFTFRQDSYSIHKDTKTIPAIWTAANNRSIVYFNQYIKHQDAFNKLLGAVVAALQGHYNCKCDVLRAMVAKVPAGMVIPEHIDQAPLFDTMHRVHIPLTHPKGCNFYIEGEVVPMEVGTVVNINNKKKHKVENFSAFDRLHFICDVEPV